MSPRQKTTASSSRSASRASSTASTLPLYPGSPPPSYWTPATSSTSTSSSPPYSGSSSSSSSSRSSSSQLQYTPYPSGKPSPYTGFQSQTSAPVMKIIDLPNVKDQTPPTLLQTTQCIAHTLLEPDPSLDFAAPIPNMEHLGPATEPLLISFPLTFEFDDRIYSIERTKGVRIHEIATFVYQFLQEKLSEEEKERQEAPLAQRRIDLVGQRTKFGGLELSAMKGAQCVWLVKLVS